MARRSPVAKKASTSSAKAPPAPPMAAGKRQPVLLSRPPKSRGALCAEVAGGTAADCAAICCCCPCAILSLVVLAVVKLPAEICKKAFRKRKRKSGGAGEGGGAGTTTRLSLLGAKIGSAEDEEDDVRIQNGATGALLEWPAEKSPSVEVSEMDMEMWAHFYGAGFWRSPSQRDD